MSDRSTYYDAIFLSPHLDDAAFSCGGQIYTRTAAGQRVLIVTFMAGDPPQTAVSDYAAAMHDRWELAADIVAARRAEDVAACRILGADYRHASLLDAIYRVHPDSGEPFVQSNNALFGPVQPADAAVTQPQIEAILVDLPAHGRCFAPLTVGNHVDHQLVRRAAEAVFGSALYYFEDFPYVRISGALDAVIPTDRAGWHAETIPLDDAAIQARIEAIAAYQSQVSSFFNGRSDIASQIHAETTKTGGERVWQQRV